MPVNSKKYALLQNKIKSLRLRVAKLQKNKLKKKQLETLQKSDLLYRTLIENIHIGISLIDTKHRIVMTNIGQGRIFGKPRSEFVGKFCFEEFEKRSKVCPHCPGTQSMATGRPAEVKTEGVRDDGSRIAAYLRTFPVFERDGSISGFIEIAEDITEYKQTEESLRESEKRFKAIFDNAADGILIADVKTKKLYLGNKAICRMLGYKPEEIKNKMVSDIHLKEHLPFVLKQFGKMAKSETALAENIPVKRKNGSILYADINSFPIVLAGKTYLAGIFRDITERKKAEEALRTSQAQLSNAMKIAKLGYWEYDVAEDMFTFNDQFYSIFRTSAEKVGGYKMSSARYARQFLHPDDVYMVEEEIKKAIKTTDPHFSRLVEHRIIYADGEIGYMAVRHFVVKDKKGRTIKTFGANQDITEYKKAQEELRQAEAKYRTLVEQIPAVTYISALDKTSTTIYVSPQIQQFLGFSQREYNIDHDLWLKQLHPDDRRRILDSLHLSHRGKQPFNCEYRMFRKDGRVVWFRDEAVMVCDDFGKPMLMQGVMFDITAQKQAEEKLKESEERFKTIFDNATDGILLTDARTRKFYLGNKAICKMLGYRPEEIKNLTVLDITPKELSSYAIEQFGRIARGEASLVGDKDVPVKRRDGSVFYAAISAFPITLGGEMYITGVLRDVTDRKKTEEALYESEERFRSLAETTSDWIWEVDTNGIYTYVSPKVKDLLGYEPDEVIGKTPFDLMIPSEAKNVREKFRAIVESRKPFTGLENTNLHKNGRCVVLETSGVPVFDTSGNLLRYRGIDRDVTERRKVEEKLNIYREKMAQAERLASLGTLSATIAHELNQPLTVIRLSIENSLEDLESTSRCEAVEGVLKDALKEVINATSVVDRFRNYARQSSKKNLCETNLNAVADRIVQLLSKTAQRSRMTLNLKGLDKLPPVYSNEKDLEQLFFALTENAIQAAGNKKRYRLTIEGVIKGENIELRFADNCCGISPGNIDKIFDPFFTTGSDEGRTGLGLPIVHRIVSECGGRIRVQSRIGKGTTFYITLPICLK